MTYETWLSIIVPSCRPNDLNKWLNSLYKHCDYPKGIELSLILEDKLDIDTYYDWGRVIVKYVKHGEYNVNQLQEIGYRNSLSPFIMLSGDDTICKTDHWDTIFKKTVDKYPDQIVLAYPDDTIFHESLACYPVVSRVIMDHMDWPVPYERYAIDDTIFDIVPRDRRIYLPNVVMQHNHYNETGPGHPFVRDSKQVFYPIDQDAMSRDRPIYEKLQGRRNEIRSQLNKLKIGPKVKVMIAIPTQEFARRADFYDYVNMLEKPEETVMTVSHGQSPARNRNIMIEQALNNDCTHILFLDDDMAFKPNLLNQLLAHDKDMVSGVYLMRNYPHFPVFFDQQFEDGRCKFSFLENGRKGLVEAVNTGLGACLIKTDVFRKMSEELGKVWITLGELEKDHWCDDIAFFNKCRKAGFHLYVDLDCPVGHMMTAIIWPDRATDGTWFTAYNTGSPEIFRVPQVIPNQEQLLAAGIK